MLGAVAMVCVSAGATVLAMSVSITPGSAMLGLAVGAVTGRGNVLLLAGIKLPFVVGFMAGGDSEPGGVVLI